MTTPMSEQPRDLMAALRASLEAPAYLCTCGDTFPSHLARVVHAASCPAMQPGRPATPGGAA